MAKAPPSFDFYPGDFIKSCVCLSPEEIGCHIRLLCYQWEHGHIPSDSVRLMRICGTHSETDWVSIWGQISDRYEPIEGSTSELAHPRMFNDRNRQAEKYTARVERNKKNGSKGGRPRKPTRPELENPVGNEKEPTSEGGREKGEVVNTDTGSAQLAATMPAEFQTEEFRGLLKLWCDHKATDGKPVDAISFEAQKLKFIRWGVQATCTAIENAVAGQWKTIHEPSEKEKKSTAPDALEMYRQKPDEVIKPMIMGG